MLIKFVGIAVLMAVSTVCGVIAALFHIVMFGIRQTRADHGPSRRQRNDYRAHLARVEEGLIRR